MKPNSKNFPESQNTDINNIKSLSNKPFTNLIQFVNFDNIFTVNKQFASNEFSYSENIDKLTGFIPTELNQFEDGIYSLVHKEDISLVKKAFTDIEDASVIKELNISFRIKNRESDYIWVKQFLVPVIDEISSTGFNSIIVIVDDIKIKELENLEIYEAEKKKNDSKDKFVSIISHDLRSPFTSLLGFSEILLNEEDLSEEETSEYLEYIYSASKTQLQLINNLLDWSRLQTGRVKPELKRINVKTLLSNCISTKTGDAVRKDINIKASIDPILYFSVDERLISKAIDNLLNNAIKYSERKKKISVYANNFKKGRIEIIVKDEGIGIPDEGIDKIFKIDEKFSNPGTEGERGSGLGLTLVNEIVNSHGGDIWVYSKPNEGTEVHLTLEQAQNSLLIVENEEKIRNEFTELFNSKLQNTNLIFTNNGYEAINSIQKNQPSLIIANHSMPLMNGYQLAEVLNKKGIIQNIPLFIYTDNPNKELRTKYSSYDVHSIFEYPLDLNLLVQEIVEIIHS